MNKMFDLGFVLKNIKVVFLDFDDTLCLHYNLEETKESDDEFFKVMLNGSVNHYLDETRHGAVKELQDFVEVCTDVGIDCHCLSYSDTNLMYNAKRLFLDKKYPNVKSLYFTGTREGKLKFMNDFCKATGVDKFQILLVDDHPSTRHKFRENGFYAVNVTTIMQYLQKNPI